MPPPPSARDRTGSAPRPADSARAARRGWCRRRARLCSRACRRRPNPCCAAPRRAPPSSRWTSAPHRSADAARYRWAAGSTWHPRIGDGGIGGTGNHRFHHERVATWRGTSECASHCLGTYLGRYRRNIVMAYQPNPNDPYRAGLSEDEMRHQARLNSLDNELQADPELAEGPASGAKVAMFALAIAVVLGAVFYGLNNTTVNNAGTSPPSQTAQQTQPANPTAP